MKKKKKSRVKKKRSKKKMTLAITIGIVIILTALYFTQSGITGKSTTTLQNVEVQPLSEQLRKKVVETIAATEFLKDMPKKSPAVLRFYKYENGEIIWQDGFLITNNFPLEPLSNAEPTLYVSIPSKYISELTGNNLCEVIRKAKNNGEISFYSEHNSAILLIKYAKMLKYRDCFEG